MSGSIIGPAIILIAALAFLAFVIAAGISSARAEQDYWDAYWLDTPSTEGDSDVVSGADDTLANDLPKAA